MQLIKKAVFKMIFLKISSKVTINFLNKKILKNKKAKFNIYNQTKGRKLLNIDINYVK